MSRSWWRRRSERTARLRDFFFACGLLATAAVIPGCACASESEPQLQLASLSGAEGSRLRGPGASPSSPLERCGARDSYDYLASQFRCPGPGKNPFRGNWREAASHRVGSTPTSEDGHMLDVYEVPCTQGPVHVYVDMYSCESGSP